MTPFATAPNTSSANHRARPTRHPTGRKDESWVEPPPRAARATPPRFYAARRKSWGPAVLIGCATGTASCGA